MTIVQFSERIGLSTATISRAFSGNGRISETTRLYVREQAALCGYRPNLQARNMVRRQTETIAFFYDAPEKLDSDYYLGELTCGIGDATRERGRYLQTFTVPPGAAKAPSMMVDLVLSRSIDGFVVNLRQPWAEELVMAAESQAMPYVFIDNTRPGDDVTLSLMEEIEKASSQAGAYLVKLGRRRPAMIRGIHDEGKLAGFRAGLGPHAAQLAVHPGGKTFEAGGQAAIDLLRDYPAIDCLFCANDVLAIGAIRALLDAGCHVPEDVAVIGCDDLAMARYSEPPLTTLNLPKYNIGAWSVRKLLALIDKEPLSHYPDLACTLVVRRSA